MADNSLYLWHFISSDGMLDHENSQLSDRVACLEKRVQQQDDEIICLKSALSDCLRRLQALESGKCEYGLCVTTTHHLHIL